MQLPNLNSSGFRFLGLFCLSFLTASISGQQAITFGDQSPIIRGVNNRISYFNEEKTAVRIPQEVLPLLAGVMIVNKSDPTSAVFQSAIQAWLEKYALLESKIAEMTDVPNRQLAKRHLLEGNFPEVEKLLRIRTGYLELEKYFPASYQTTGRQSPVLIGDNSTVSYVVNKVIEYKLPESLTKNLLERIYAQDRKIEGLNLKISDRDQALENWINQYRKLEVQLRSNPDSVNQKAWLYFKQGNLEAALAEIEKVKPSEKSMARISFLKAQIRLLEYDYLHYEASYQEISKLFQIATLFDERSSDIVYQYALFTSEFSQDGPRKVEILDNAFRSIPADSVQMKLNLLLQLSDACSNLQRYLPAEEYLRQAQRLIPLLADEKDRAKAAFFMHLAFGRVYGTTNQRALTAEHCDSAIAIGQRYPEIKNKNLRSWYVVVLNRLVQQVTDPQTRTAGLKSFMDEIAAAENTLKEGMTNQLFLLDRYGFAANQFWAAGDIVTAKKLFSHISERLQVYINPNSQLCFQLYFQNWLVMLNLISQNAQFKEWELQLIQMDSVIHRMQVDMPAGTLEKNRLRLDYEYAIYLKAIQKPTEALVKFQHCLEMFIDYLPQNPEEFSGPTAKCIDEIGACYSLMYRTAEGISQLYSLIGKIERIQSLDDRNYTLAKVKIYRQMGALYQLAGKLDSARLFLQKGLRESEIRLSAANDLFLYDFVTLSFELSGTYLSIDNARAIEIMDAGKSKVENYMVINPALRQRYLPDLAYTTGYTAHVYALSRDFQNAYRIYGRAYDLYHEIQNPGLPVAYMSASFMSEFCDFLENADYLFSKLSRKDRSEIADRKCALVAESIAAWKQLPDDPSKLQQITRLNRYLQQCK